MFGTVNKTQLIPPLVVLRKVFDPPMMNPFRAEGNFTSKSVCVVPDVCGLHVVPPFDVKSIFPLAPTTHPVFILIKNEENRFSVVPDVCCCQSDLIEAVKMKKSKITDNFILIAALLLYFLQITINSVKYQLCEVIKI